MRRVWFRGRLNTHKRYLIHVDGYNLGLIMRMLTGAGTPRASFVRQSAWLFVLPTPDGGMIALLCAVLDDQTTICAISITPDPFD
jgi:transposase